MATYIEMFKRISRSAWFPSSDADFANGSENTATIKELIQESNMKNAAITPSRPLTVDISLIAGQDTYDLPATYSKMRLVNYYQSNRKIEIYPISNDKFLTLKSVVANSTLFIYYTLNRVTNETTWAVKNTISIYPTPWTTGQTVTIDYLTVPAKLNIDPGVSTDSTINLVAVSPFEQIDKYWALGSIFATREQPTQAKYYDDKYAEEFEKYRTFIDVKTETVVVKQGIRTQMNPNLYPVLS